MFGCRGVRGRGFWKGGERKGRGESIGGKRGRGGAKHIRERERGKLERRIRDVKAIVKCVRILKEN